MVEEDLRGCKMRLVALLILLAALPLVSAASKVDFYVTAVEPDVLKPGETAVLNVTLKNLGGDYALYVRAILNPNSTTPLSAIGPTKSHLIARAGEARASEEFFGAVLQNDELLLQYPVLVDEDAKFGLHNVPLKLVWRNPNLELEEETLYLGIRIVGEADLEIAKVNTTPSRVFADKDVSLAIAIENTGKEDAESVRAELVLPRGFTGETTAFMGKIAKGSSATAAFNLRAEKDVPSGTHVFGLVLTYVENGVQKQARKNFEVFVQEYGEVSLAIADVSTDPAKVYPDSDFALSLGLENIGNGDAKSVEVLLTLPQEFSGKYSAFLGALEEGKKSTAKFELKASKEATPVAYDTKAKIEYTDERGLTHEIEKNFQVFVHERGEVKIEIAGITASPPKLTPGSDFTLSIQLENVGKQDAKSVKAVIGPRQEFTGERTSFLGSIKKDDLSTAIFDMAVDKKAKAGTYDIVLDVTFTDERGVEYNDEKSFELIVAEKERELWPYGLAAALIIAGGLFVWRRGSRGHEEG